MRVQGLPWGKYPLFDSTNHTKESRDALRKVAVMVNSESFVVYIKTPIETVWKRWEENTKNKERSVVSRELVQMTIDGFEIPEKNENVFVIDN